MVDPTVILTTCITVRRQVIIRLTLAPINVGVNDSFYFESSQVVVNNPIIYYEIGCLYCIVYDYICSTWTYLCKNGLNVFLEFLLDKFLVK